jgi:hypothetical protein
VRNIEENRSNLPIVGDLKEVILEERPRKVGKAIAE